MVNDMKRPTLHTEPYPAISVEGLKGTLDAQVVVITGAGGVLGGAESLAFAKSGAKLALVDLSRAATSLEAVVNECRAIGAFANGYHCNVTDPTESKKTLDKIREDLGPVDVLVNNAGNMVFSNAWHRTIDRPFHMETFDQFWGIVNLNFKAPLLWMHILTDSFRQRKKGTIINIASRSATVNSPFSANYAAAKAALVRASGCLQLELDMDGLENIDIYSLHPGATKTNIQKPLPQDVAARYPAAADAYVKFTAKFPCDPSLCGQTCVYLAAGRVNPSVVGILTASRMWGGLPNDGGNMPDSVLMEL